MDKRDIITVLKSYLLMMEVKSALENYIISTIEYPQDAIDNNVEGNSQCTDLRVDEKGNISNVSTVGKKLDMDWKKKR